MLRQTLVSLSLSILCTPSFAEVVATQHIEKEIARAQPNGGETIERVAADTVAPGEEVIYSLRFENKADAPAEAIVLVMPVPEEITYVEGSITGEKTGIAFSADGGQTYVARGRLTVVEDGQERPAKGDEITHIKWTYNGALGAGARGEVSYRGILK